MKLGIIGCGNMAGSMLTQMLVNGFVQKEDVMASAYHEKRRKQLRERYGIAVTDDNVDPFRGEAGDTCNRNRCWRDHGWYQGSVR